jgi:uncharacterized protein YyaL (SSP411 family)
MAQEAINHAAVATKRLNRLAGSKSPYLLQHAENPVDWFPWGDEAFEKAVSEDKPIFLSIGYSTDERWLVPYFEKRPDVRPDNPAVESDACTGSAFRS